MHTHYPMNLQLFAEPADPDGAENQPVATEQDEPTQDAEAIVLTPDEYTARITAAKSQAGRNALDKWLKEQGIDKETLDALVAAHKQGDPASEPPKPPEQVAAETGVTTGEVAGDTMRNVLEKLSAEQQKSLTLERQLVALGKGIPADKAQKYVQLAELYLDAAEGDFDKALDAATDDFPLPRPNNPRFVAPATRGSTHEKSWKNMSLAERSALYAKDPEGARALAKQAGERLEA